MDGSRQRNLHSIKPGFRNEILSRSLDLYLNSELAKLATVCYCW